MSTGLVVASGVVAPSLAGAGPLGSNEAIRIGVIGFCRKGSQHIRQLLELEGCRIVALCDVDPVVLAREETFLRDKGIKVFATTDARRLLERDDVDAVVIATSNHWHALLTVWSCQAGKDVYVEKPISHTIGEGRVMIRAASRYGRIVQCGTQYRSDKGVEEAVAWVREGNLGRVKHIHTQCFKHRGFIGLRAPWYPKGLDYDLFCGPAPLAPLQRNELHYDWHWSWATGNAELGNNGIHTLDIARRFAAIDTLPSRVMSLGGRFVHRDAAETPNTHFAIFEYTGGPTLFFESRGLKAAPDAEHMDQYKGVRDGLVVECEGGYYAGYGGGGAYEPGGKLIRRFKGDGGGNHMRNFLDAVRSRRAQDLAAPLSEVHLSTALCHLGNLSYRLGRRASPTAWREALRGSEPANAALDRTEEHLVRHGIDLRSEPLTLGPWIVPDPATEGIAALEGGHDYSLEYAQALCTGARRPGYELPEIV